MSQQAKDKILERLKGLKDSEIVDGITTLAAEYIERDNSLFRRLSERIVGAAQELIDGLPGRVKLALKFLGVKKWIDNKLRDLQTAGPRLLAKELRDFSQPE